MEIVESEEESPKDAPVRLDDDGKGADLDVKRCCKWENRAQAEVGGGQACATAPTDYVTGESLGLPVPARSKRLPQSPQPAAAQAAGPTLTSLHPNPRKLAPLS